MLNHLYINWQEICMQAQKIIVSSHCYKFISLHIQLCHSDYCTAARQKNLYNCTAVLSHYPILMICLNAIPFFCFKSFNYY